MKLITGSSDGAHCWRAYLPYHEIEKPRMSAEMDVL